MRHIPRYLQARHLIGRFGSAAVLAAALGIDRVVVFRWSHPVEKQGQDGLVPAKYIKRIAGVARDYGVLLGDADWALRPNPDYRGNDNG